MSDDLNEVREHLARHDQDIADLNGTVASERGLRAMMDQDLATERGRINVQEKLLQAIATTQGQHTRMLSRLEGRVMRVEDRVESIDNRLVSVVDRVTGIEGKLDETRTGVLLILGLLTRPDTVSGGQSV